MSERRYGALLQLATSWRREAVLFERRGNPALASAALSYARDLEEAIRAFEADELSLSQAAAESGFSYSALEKMVRAGRIPNAGETRSPRIRRADLPRKAPRARGEEPDLAADVLGRKAGSGASLPR